MILDEPRQIDLSFSGKGGQLFKLFFVNMLLTSLTVGLYFPWAKTNIQRYFHNKTILENEGFMWHGTGGEMLMGYIKAVGFIAALGGTMFLLIRFLLMPGFVIAMLLYLTAITLATPYAIHGALKYRTSRTSWRGVHFGYRGQFGAFAQQFITGWIFTCLSLGIYGAWFIEKQRNYILGNLRFGNITFNYNGNGKALFFLTLKGMLLTICTLGIYFFWYNKDAFNYYLKNLTAEQDGRSVAFRSELTGGALLGHALTNMLLVVCTLGIGFSWAIVRSQRFLYANLIIEGAIDEQSLINTEEAYTDATGEGLLEAMDVAL